MPEFDELIGTDCDSASKYLGQNGYNNIKIVLNSKHIEGCDTKLVCAVRVEGNSVTLICGEFLVD